MPAPIAIQLYTVRDLLEKNFKAVVTQIAEMGYVGVETAGFPNISVLEASDLFADLGLQVCSAHTQLPYGKQKNQVIELADGRALAVAVASDDRAVVDPRTGRLSRSNISANRIIFADSCAEADALATAALLRE